MFEHVETPTTNDIDLLKIGRHFRFDSKSKLIVGRNKEENDMIRALKLPKDILFEAKDYVGPTSLLRGEESDEYLQLAAQITLRYSDAPKNGQSIIIIEKLENNKEISVNPAVESAYLKLRI